MPSRKSALRKQRQQLQEDVLHVVVEFLGKARAHHSLARLDGERSVASDFIRERQGFLQQQLVGNDAIEQAQFQALRGFECATGEDDLGCLRPADETGQEPGAAALGQHADVA